jgi:hypothetical protein
MSIDSLTQSLSVDSILGSYLVSHSYHRVSSFSLFNRIIRYFLILAFSRFGMVGQSRIKLKDVAWCFFRPKENKYGRGDQQMRKTKSGFWKSTGRPKPIMRNRQQIGEKKILMFYTSKESKSDWVIHEYHGFSHNQVLSVFFLCYLLLLRF